MSTEGGWRPPSAHRRDQRQQRHPLPNPIPSTCRRPRQRGDPPCQRPV